MASHVWGCGVWRRMQRGISQLRVVSQVVTNNKEGGRPSFSVFLLFYYVVGRYGFFSFFLSSGGMSQEETSICFVVSTLRFSSAFPTWSYRCDTGEGRGRSE